MWVTSFLSAYAGTNFICHMLRKGVRILHPFFREYRAEFVSYTLFKVIFLGNELCYKFENMAKV